MRPSDIDKLGEIIDPAIQTIAAHRLEFVLPPQGLLRETYAIPDLVWHSIPYNDPTALDSVPDDKPGLYAFAIRAPRVPLPPHGYILYIGSAGKSPNRSLRDRYQEYLKFHHVIKRERIARMIRSWHETLTFHFAPAPGTVTWKDIERMEKQMNSALIPPFSVKDLDSTLKQHRRAFS